MHRLLCLPAILTRTTWLATWERSVSEMFEIAYAALTNRLCFFTGTGFSKAVTENAAPSWQALLEAACEACPDPATLKASLFPTDEPNPLTLEESAQVVAIELTKNSVSIHNNLAKQIESLSLKGDNKVIEEFCKSQSFRVVTTNYDKLMEDLCGEEACTSVTPGLPVPRSGARVKVYHVHGSIDAPARMVVTSDDYFRFINTGSYFAKKLSTLLHENTVVILGYSLGDTNLKAILSDYRGFSKSHVIGSNIFFVSRSEVPTSIKDYYAYCYGIRVIDATTVHEFFTALQALMSSTKTGIEESVKTIKQVVSGTHTYNAEFIKLDNSFYEVISALSAVGISIDDPRAVSLIGDIIEKKTAATNESGAWEQYNHLAGWLIYLSSMLELRGTSVEGVFLDATKRSMTTMSRTKAYGYSWQAFRSWDAKWDNIISSNRILIKEHILANTKDADALYIVNKL